MALCFVSKSTTKDGQANNFGEVDINGSLVASHSSVSEDIIMVNNGWLCCTVRGDLVKMLLKEVKPGSLLTPSSADGVVTLVDLNATFE
ncbi:hypothetical protein CMV_029518 [Castanea mollissima]|uniref:CobW/HypB/UreG nucleotide-binding domain-containing protein n=1 Tax=Castanea mollissima TaxID=60419 RepID=A0A8J4QB80_9ROSI|nr:hypothetical protein CMV_029518 [Castanea mollissima]